MGRNRKLHSISEYCARHGLEIGIFFDELVKHPKYSERLRTNSRGEYVIDEDALMYVGDILRARKSRCRMCAGTAIDKKGAVAAVAAEINSLTYEKEQLRAEIKRLTLENERLRRIIKDGETEKRHNERKRKN